MTLTIDRVASFGTPMHSRCVGFSALPWGRLRGSASARGRSSPSQRDDGRRFVHRLSRAHGLHRALNAVMCLARQSTAGGRNHSGAHTRTELPASCRAEEKLFALRLLAGTRDAVARARCVRHPEFTRRRPARVVPPATGFTTPADAGTLLHTIAAMKFSNRAARTKTAACSAWFPANVQRGIVIAARLSPTSLQPRISAGGVRIFEAVCRAGSTAGAGVPATRGSRAT